MIDNALARAKGELLTETDVEIQGRPGIEFVMASPNGLVQRVRVIVAELEVFQLMVACPMGEESSTTADAFFASFKLLE